MNVTELAAELGVSPSTVSRVLRGNAAKYRISKATVERVEEAAKRHQVTPDPIGSGLQSGRTGMVGLLVPDITNPFFAGLARSLELSFREEGMTVQLGDSAEDPVTEWEVLRQMINRRLDGLVVAPVGRNSPEFVEVVNEAKMPIIMVDRVIPELGFPMVGLDNAEAGRMAVEHLVEMGHREIGFLRGGNDSFTDRERMRGAAEAMGDAKLQMKTEFVSGSGYTRAESFDAALQLLSRPKRPSAIVALSGQGTLGILEAVNELGISIPADLSMVAFDEQPWSAFVSPPLTTISQPVEDLGRIAKDLMWRLINGQPLGKMGEFRKAELRPRNSVRRVDV
ncbi:MAG: LacI family DNA-binding transcriptional regulator [Verrucomicrobiota bacterium]